MAGAIRFTVTEEPITVLLMLPSPLEDIILHAPTTVRPGEIVTLIWSGTTLDGDIIGIADPEDSAGFLTVVPARPTGDVALEMPTDPATYELRYWRLGERQPRATAMITMVAH